MKTYDLNSTQIVRYARRIYRLVCSGKDIQANTELRRCGDNAIEIANELISGEFHSTTALRLIDRSGWFVLVASPAAIAAYIVFRTGMPQGLLLSLFRVLMFVILCLFGYAVEVLVVCSFRSWNHERWTTKWCDRGRRTKDIACRVLLEDTSSHPQIIGSLLMALAYPVPPSAAIQTELHEELVLRIHAADADQLSRLPQVHVAAVDSLLLLVLYQLHLCDAMISWAPSVNWLVKYRHSLSIAKALLRVCQHAPTTRENEHLLRQVHYLATLNDDGCSPEISRLIEMARETEAIIQPRNE